MSLYESVYYKSSKFWPKKNQEFSQNQESNCCNSESYSKFMGFLAQQHFFLPTSANLDTTVSMVMKVCISHPSIWLNTLKYGFFCVVLFSILHV